MKLSHSTTLLSQMQRVKDTTLKKLWVKTQNIINSDSSWTLIFLPD